MANYAADTSVSANTLTIALSPAVAALTTGMRIWVKVANTNTGAVVINTNGLGNVSAVTPDGNALAAGALQANGIYPFAYDGNKWELQGVPSAPVAPLAQCRFDYTSGTVCTLNPSNGNKVSLPNGSVCTVPSAGISTTISSCYLNGVAASSLSASTLYYAYLAYISSNWVIDWSTTAPAVDTSSGLYVKTGDATRLFVGAAVTNATPNFVNADGNRLVASWFNPQVIRSRTAFSATRSTASTTFVEVNSEIRNNVLVLPGRSVDYAITGTVNNSGTGTTVTGIGFDGTTAENEASSFGTGTTANGPVALQGTKTGLSTGSHYATLLGMTNANTSNWYSATSNSVAQINLNLKFLG